MRMQDRLVDPDRPQGRQHGTVKLGPDEARSQWGQRPLFSIPGEDQPPPVQMGLGPEATRDPPIPEDRSVGSAWREELEKGEPETAILPRSRNNVGSPPTEAEIDTAFGPRTVGWIGMIIDGGGAGVVWLIVRSEGNLWYYEQMTKAV